MTITSRWHASNRPILKACAIIAIPPLLSFALAWASWNTADRAMAEADRAHDRLLSARTQVGPQDAVGADGAAPARLLMQGDTIGVSGATFQSLLTDIAELSGATLEQVDPIVAEAAGVLTQMHSRTTLSGADTDIMNLVLNLEAAEPLIFVDRVDVTPLDDRGDRLRIEMELSAYAASGTIP